MDRITSALVNEFSTQYNLVNEPSHEQFEHFVNLAIVSSQYQESFDPSDVHVGKNGTQGLDGIAIIVNGALVTDSDEVTDLIDRNKKLEVTFIFTQAKTSSKFEGGDIGTFMETVRDFFRDQPNFPRPPAIEKHIRISEIIFQNTSKLRTNPTLKLFFVTTGKWTKDANLVGRLDQGQSDLEATNLFTEVKVFALGAQEIQKLYRQTHEPEAIEIDFPQKVTLPEIPGVGQAFIGILSAATFFKLITDNAGSIRRSVFQENIRDFQGDTSVNENIGATLSDADTSKSFVVLNNGVTIVCRELKQTGTKCILAGHQIVNGCQTSNVLFENRNKFVPETVFIPTKLVGTGDERLVNDIIRSTNSQNAVKPEELEAMTDFQKELESYYSTYATSHQSNMSGALYYERRSKQWASSDVEKTRIVTIPNQIKSIASMFLDLPHQVSGYYGTVRSRLGESIFRSDHIKAPYYTSALALYRLESLFRARNLNAKYKPYRWFLLMLLRHKIGTGDLPSLNSRKIESYCEKIINVLVDTDASSQVFDDLLLRVAPIFDEDQNHEGVKTQAMRDRLLSRLNPD